MLRAALILRFLFKEVFLLSLITEITSTEKVINRAIQPLNACVELYASAQGRN